MEQEGGEGANRPTFRMEVDGELGCYTVDFPNDKDILDSFMCKIPDGLDPHDWNHLGFVRNSSVSLLSPFFPLLFSLLLLLVTF